MNRDRVNGLAQRLLDLELDGKHIYIAGPMTWIPAFNFPAFMTAADELRMAGAEVVSPAELDSEESRAAALASPDGDPAGYFSATGETHGDLLARDVKLVADVIDAVVVLPGWRNSQGARLEVFIAYTYGKPVFALPFLERVTLPDWPGAAPYVEVVETFVQHIAAQTQTPPHFWDGPTSGEALRAWEKPKADLYARKVAEYAEALMPLADWTVVDETHVHGPDLSAYAEVISATLREQDRALGGRLYGATNATPSGEWTDGSTFPWGECGECCNCETPAEELRAAEETDGEVRVVDARTGGEKGTKRERMELLPWDVLRRDVAPHYAEGAKKYSDNNWRRGYAWSLSFGALQRHAALWYEGEELDEETGTPHMAAVVFHALALLHFARAHRDLDDRPATA